MATSDGSPRRCKGCCLGVSTWSRPCFERVKPTWAAGLAPAACPGAPHGPLAGHRYHLPITMTDRDPTASGHVGRPDAGPPDPGPDDVVGRVGPLRGATVEFNARRVLQVVLGVVVGT